MTTIDSHTPIYISSEKQEYSSFYPGILCTMASPVGYSDRRQLGLKRKTDYVDIGGGKIKRRVRMKGFNSNKATLLGDSMTQFMYDMINCSV